jgi:hypothetical protein
MEIIKKLDPVKPNDCIEVGTCITCGSPVWQRVSIILGQKSRPIFNCMCRLSPIKQGEHHKPTGVRKKKLDIKKIESKPKNFYMGS